MMAFQLSPIKTDQSKNETYLCSLINIKIKIEVVVVLNTNNLIVHNYYSQGSPLISQSGVC